MKKFLASIFCLSLLAAWAFNASAQQTSGPGQTILCPKLATLTSAGSTSQLVAGVSGQSISICGWHITNTATSGTFALVSGTGSNCGTNQATIIPPQNVTSTAPATDHIDFAFTTLSPGLALCMTPSTPSIAGVVYFTQF